MFLFFDVFCFFCLSFVVHRPVDYLAIGQSDGFAVLNRNDREDRSGSFFIYLAPERYADLIFLRCTLDCLLTNGDVVEPCDNLLGHLGDGLVFCSGKEVQLFVGFLDIFVPTASPYVDDPSSVQHFMSIHFVFLFFDVDFCVGYSPSALH